MAFETVDPDLLARLATYESALIQNADVLVRGHLPAEEVYSGPSLRYMTPELGTRVGYAVTLEVAPQTLREDALDTDEFFDAVAYAGVPTIAVVKDIDTDPHRGATVGDEMAYRMRAIGCQGAVVDGAVRDVPGVARAGCALWAVARVPGHGASSYVRVNSPVTVAGLRVNAGDILVGDGDGVTRVPVSLAEEIAEACELVRTKEAKTFAYMSDPDFNLDKYEDWKQIREPPY